MEKPYVIGVDLGGTNTVFGVVDARGNVVVSASIKTGTHNDIELYLSDLVSRLEGKIRSEVSVSVLRTGTTSADQLSSLQTSLGRARFPWHR